MREPTLYYEVPNLAGARIGVGLGLGLDHAVRMLTRVIDAAPLDPTGTWYCEVAR